MNLIRFALFPLFLAFGLESANAVLKCYNCGYGKNPNKCSSEKDDPRQLQDCKGETIGKNNIQYYRHVCTTKLLCVPTVEKRCYFGRNCARLHISRNLTCDDLTCECDEDGCNGVALDKKTAFGPKDASQSVLIVPWKLLVFFCLLQYLNFIF